MTELATVARPYAKALYSLAQERNKLESWLKQLSVLSEVSLNPKVQILIESPKFSKNQKIDSFSSIVGKDGLDGMLENFLVILIENNRVQLINAIYELYKEMVLATEGIGQATLYSAYPLSDDEFADLVRSVETHCGAKLATKLVIEPELIGGFKVEFGDQVLDMSVKSELDSLYQTMTS
ncbi:MAG: F0F1 ATP synthase subunit delta [Neisseriaceae bacterium]|nr:MAG: F0F1 ATP synthase subunit delta [Neisseriaceae bacterium]